MRRQFTSRPAPVISAIAATLGVFMLIFGFVFLSKSSMGTGIIGVFMVVWIVAVLTAIIYHATNALRPGGVPTNIIEADDATPSPKTSADRVNELEELRNRKLISDAEYESKRQEILKQV